MWVGCNPKTKVNDEEKSVMGYYEMSFVETVKLPRRRELLQFRVNKGRGKKSVYDYSASRYLQPPNKDVRALTPDIP